MLFNLPIWSEATGLALRLSAAAAWPIFFAWALALHEIATDYIKACFCILFIALSFAAIQLEKGSYTMQPKLLPVLAANAEKLQKVIPPDAFIHASHGYQFAFTYYTRRSSAKEMPRLPTYSMVYRMSETPAQTEQCLSIDDAAERQTQPSPPCILLTSTVALIRV